MTPALVAALLIAALAALLAIGAPVAVALGLSALVTVLIASPGDLPSLVNVLFGVPLRPTLLPVPLFIVMGLVLGQSALVRHLIDFADRLVGRLPGGLGVVTVVTGIFFAGISGSGPADVAALGAILIPALVASGYARPRAAALLAASGGLGIVVPPSIALILYAFVAQGGVQDFLMNHPGTVATAPSIERLFLGGVIPGILLGLAMALLLVFTARRHGIGRGRPRAEGIPTSHLAVRALPGLLVPVLILGGIYSGLFTATQSAAVVTLYALIVEIVLFREMRWRAVGDALWRAGRTTAQVLLLVGCASMFSHALVLLELDRPAVEALRSLAHSPLTFLLALNLVVLALGCVIDAISILFIITPIALPVALGLGVDPVHLGVILVVNLAIGQITPPVGVNLFVAASVSGERLGPICRAVVPFVIVELIVLALVSAIPALCLAG
ncbi:TRAP transporter large permease [Candidatus Sumerlaeota bacterium]|nr:TRAP transporter large permease [Candidatus Sumerlaeota bacterium]